MTMLLCALQFCLGIENRSKSHSLVFISYVVLQHRSKVLPAHSHSPHGLMPCAAVGCTHFPGHSIALQTYSHNSHSRWHKLHCLTQPQACYKAFLATVIIHTKDGVNNTSLHSPFLHAVMIHTSQVSGTTGLISLVLPLWKAANQLQTSSAQTST